MKGTKIEKVPHCVVECDPKYSQKPKDHRPFFLGERYLYLGEVVNMPGHAIVVGESGLVQWGFHSERFAAVCTVCDGVGVCRCPTETIVR